MRALKSWNESILTRIFILRLETEGSRFHTEVTYPEDVFFVFGKETKGLPKAIVEKYADTLIRLPMRKGLRSLNRSNAAAVMVYEALRQRGFE